MANFYCGYFFLISIIFSINAIGLKETSQLEAFLSVKRTQILNYITRNGARMANTFGTIALTYSAIGVGLSFIQDSNDDANTLVSAILSGALYGALSKPSTDPIPTGILDYYRSIRIDSY